MDRFEIERIPGTGSLADAFTVRRQVFIEEQNVSEAIEMDGKDDDATHVLVIDTEENKPVGTARLRRPKPALGKPERVAVLPEYRKQGLGRRLMEAIEAEAIEAGCQKTLLHAQTSSIGFYESVGYHVTSYEFEEAGIPHVEMEKEL